MHIPKTYILLLALCCAACTKKKPGDDETPAKPWRNPEYNAGGKGTVFDTSPLAYSYAHAGISSTISEWHNLGKEIFFDNFSAEAGTSAGGLGPLFSQSSCVGCHPGNGRSQPPVSEIDYDSGLLMRISIAGMGTHGEPLAVPGFGTQLQTRAIDGVQAEGLYAFTYNDFQVSYSDGAMVTLHNPSHDIINPYIPLPPGVLYTMRNASPVYGLGLLESIPEADILARADEQDMNSDYISGKPNYVWNVKTDQMELGRFGWKASNATIEQQAAGAFNEDMGITSEAFFPNENGEGQSNCIVMTSTPDVTEQTINLVALYIRTLAVPAPRNLEDETVQKGRQLFHELQCTGCHTPAMQTGEGAFPELSNQVIYPYTDMLLHDMGEVLADGRPDFAASTNEWRTPPLWGIGLTQVVNPSARFLHDGRAATIEEAILWHGGEAHWIIENFKTLSLEDRKAVFAFLEAL